MLICGIYGLQKNKDGIQIMAPEKIDGVPLTGLANLRWRNATYNFKWTGAGEDIKSVTVDGKKVASNSGIYRLAKRTGTHEVRIVLSRR